MKKILWLVLGFLFAVQVSFASSLAENRANNLKFAIKTTLQKSQNPIEDAKKLKNFFLDCQKTCTDPITRDIAKLISDNFDQDFWKKQEKKTDFLSFLLLDIVDGDTIKVKGDNKEYSVRMIWLDAPESSTLRYGYAECFGREASDHLKALLSWVTQIQLETDQTQTSTDKYWRLLGYVIVNWINLNQKMIEDGYGFEYTYNLPYKYQLEFKSAQKTASEKRLWLWADSACKGERKALESQKSISVKQIVAPQKQSTSSQKIYHTWKRGWCYYYNSHWKKEYVSHSFCK